MTKELARLLDEAKKAPLSACEKEAQRRSFAYGNTAFENPLITRDMVRLEAEKLAATLSDDQRK